jgi:hypothetical protein
MDLTVEINGKVLFFKTKDLYFCPQPHEVDGCAFARFHYCPQADDVPGFTRFDQLSHVIDLEQDGSKIWSGINSSTQKSIKKAERMGADIHVNDGIEEFKSLCNEFITTKGFGSRLSEGTPPAEEMTKAHFISARMDEEMVCGNMYLESEDLAVLWISASKRLSVTSEQAKVIGDINRMIHWIEMCRAKDNGLRTFSLGTLWPPEVADADKAKWTLNNYKMRFGGETVMRYGYSRTYSRLYSIMLSTYTRMSSRSAPPASE